MDTIYEMFWKILFDLAVAFQLARVHDIEKFTLDGVDTAIAKALEWSTELVFTRFQLFVMWNLLLYEYSSYLKK